MKRVTVVGAGLGGLSAAIRLAHRGYRVTVLEKNERSGGKMNLWQDRGYTFDTGPTLLTMPFVLRDLFSILGKNLEDHLDLVRVDPICRYRWEDGLRFDVFGDFGAMEREIAKQSPAEVSGYRRFMAHAERIYEAAAGPFLFSSLSSLGARGLFRNLRNLPAVFRIDAFRTLDSAVSSHFRDPRLRQLFNRFAAYNGSSPYRAPATLAIIPYLEMKMGGWYVRGGMYCIAMVLERLARELGVEIRTGVEVVSIVQRNGAAAGVITSGEGFLPADGVVSNADALYAREHLLVDDGRRSHRLMNAQPSLAGFVLLMGIRRQFPALAHRNVFFSRDYRAEFDLLLREERPADDPTVYAALSCLDDSGHAPAGCSNLFILANAPAVSSRFDWEKEKHAYREVVLGKLSRMGVSFRPEEIETEKMITPVDFEREYHAHRGSIFGTSSNGRMSAFLRPPNRCRDMKNLYFVGGSSHPGGGIPLVLLSGKIVADLVQEDWGS